MRFILNNLLEIVPIIISIISLAISIYLNYKNNKLEKKYAMIGTYGMTLNYEVKISQKIGNGIIKFDGKEIKKGEIDIIPKIGGIEKVYAIHYYKDNVKAILPVELYTKKIEEYDAQQLFYKLPEYTIDNIAHTTKSFFGTLYLVIKDYQNNYFTNMIVYEISRNDINDVRTRIYSDIDLLHTYNKSINVIPVFDEDQMKEYQSLKRKLGQILKY